MEKYGIIICFLSFYNFIFQTNGFISLFPAQVYIFISQQYPFSQIYSVAIRSPLNVKSRDTNTQKNK
jgi:hypothetical protein